MIGLISCGELTPYQLLGRPSELSLNFNTMIIINNLDLEFYYKTSGFMLIIWPKLVGWCSQWSLCIPGLLVGF